MTESTALSTPSAEIGKQIIDSARELRRKRFSDRVVAIADREMEAVAVAEKKLEFYRQCIEISKKRLAAIEAGEFTIERGEFLFTDESLATGPSPEHPLIEAVGKVEAALRMR